MQRQPFWRGTCPPLMLVKEVPGNSVQFRLQCWTIVLRMMAFMR